MRRIPRRRIQHVPNRLETVSSFIDDFIPVDEGGWKQGKESTNG